MNRAGFLVSFLISFSFFLFAFSTVSFAHSQTQVIEITVDGFMPSEITVDTNSTIFFLNKDKESHWPASNPHPTHNLYPQFDPQMPIESGKSWAFKPTRIGEWKYHDHLNPHKGGILKVADEAGNQGITKNPKISIISDWIQTVIAYLKNTFGPKVVLEPQKFVKSSSSDQIALLKKYVDSQSAEKAWLFIKDTYKGQAGSAGNIHDLAHLVGSLLFEKENFSGIGKCSGDFAFGCFHGFLDAAFAKNLDHLSEAHDACLKLVPDLTLSGPAASCIHGIGHGIASFYQLKDLQKSLTSCRKLISGKEYCFDGVFMEFVRSAPESFYKKDNPLYPCDEIEKNFGYAYSFACGRNQPPLLLGRFKFNFDDVIKVCLGASSQPFKQACFDALGFSLASTASADQIIQSCQSIGEEEFIIRCTKSAAGELIFQDVPNWQQKAPQICNSISKDYSKECLLYLDQLKTQYSKN